MIYRVTGDTAKSGSVKRVCAVRATTRVPETALVPETRRSDYGRLKNSAHSTNSTASWLSLRTARPQLSAPRAVMEI